MIKLFFKILVKLNLIKKYNLKNFKKTGVGVQLPQNGTISSIHKINLGDFVWLGSNPCISAEGGLDIGNNVILSHNITILTSNHNFNSNSMIPYDNLTILKKVVIEDHVWIGSGVSICPGVTIKEGSVVAMGSVVTKNFPPCSIVGGNPAILIKSRNKEIYKKLKQSNDNWYMKKKYNNQIKNIFIDQNSI